MGARVWWRAALLAGGVALETPPGLSAWQGPADLILIGARAWTGDSARPFAEGIAVRGDRIVAVGSRAELARYRGPATVVREFPSGFVMPGFIDNHTHFEQAGALLLGVNLLDVASDSDLVRRVREARDRLPRGAWLVGGDWGAYESWAMGSTGGERPGAAAPGWRPHRAAIDSITPETPVLLSKWDRSMFLANAAALRISGIGCGVAGVECEAGEPTGRLAPEAAARVRAAIPSRGMEQRLAEARVALAQLREFGVTTIHDNTGPEMLQVFEELRRRGELTVRVYARPTLDRWRELQEAGRGPGSGDHWIRFGALKGFVDGIMGNSSARFYEPYLTSGERGTWRPMVVNPPGIEALIAGADSAGYWATVHAIGDEAIDTLLTIFERVLRYNPTRERRFRVIHAQVLRGPAAARRMARLGVIAEVQPYHAIDDMRWMEERIGARARWAYAFRTLQREGVMLSFGSDWPGTNAAWYTANPLLGIYAAVTRQTLDGRPPRGWFPEERVDVETALRAYTVNNAWASGEENVKGRLAPGMLADVVVLDADPLRVPPARLREIGVLLTVVGGREVRGP